MMKWLKKHKAEASREANPDAFAEDVKQRLLAWGEPSEETRARIWRHVLAASQAPAEDPHPVKRRRFLGPLRYAALVVVMLLSFLGGYVGVVLAEGDSLPGEPFYPLERIAETVMLTLTPQTRRCAMELRLLENRVYEIQVTLDIGRPLPDGLIQEMTLLISGLPETLDAFPDRRESVVAALESHHAALVALDARHPGVWELTELLNTFDVTIETLRNAPPPS
jgi:hypothetical protein